MKIECDKCGAKYSIADEKVRGKTFKIRCKKCSNVIIVRDKASAASAPEPAVAAAPGWHLAINGETVGPVTEQDVRERYQTGEIDRDTAVWQEGFEDWIPLGDVATFSDLPPRAAPPPVGGGDPFARAARDDYGASGGASVGFGGAAMGAAEASPRVTNLTGQRNENSVLFSLDNLQALATGGATRSSTSMSSGGRLAPVSSVGVGKPLATSAPTSEGSGLIDIRALGAAVGRDSGPTAGASEIGGGPPLDEALPSFGGSGFAGLAATPLVAQPAADGSEKRNSNVILIAMAALVVLLLGAMAVFAYVLLTRQPEPVERVVIKEAPSVRDLAGAAKDDDKDKDKDDKDEDEDKNKEADAKAEGEDAKEDQAGGGSQPSKRRAKSGSRARSGSSSTSKPDPTPTATPDPKPAESAGGGGGGGGSDELDVDCILNPDLPKCGKGGTSKSTKKPAPTGAADPSLPEKLTASDIRDGVNSVKADAKSCGSKNGAASGTSVKVRMSISGSTGRVVSAKAEPPHAGTALGNCVAGAVKKATFKKFRDAQMGVVYSFRM